MYKVQNIVVRVWMTWSVNHKQSYNDATWIHLHTKGNLLSCTLYHAAEHNYFISTTDSTLYPLSLLHNVAFHTLYIVISGFNAICRNVLPRSWIRLQVARRGIWNSLSSNSVTVRQMTQRRVKSTKWLRVGVVKNVTQENNEVAKKYITFQSTSVHSIWMEVHNRDTKLCRACQKWHAERFYLTQDRIW